MSALPLTLTVEQIALKRAAGKARHLAMITEVRRVCAVWESELQEWESSYTDASISARHALQRAQLIATFETVVRLLIGGGSEPR